MQIVSGGSNTLLTGEKAILSDKLLPQTIQFQRNSVIVSAGVNIGYLIYLAAQRGLSGLEFLVGIPATVGGLVKMNAGAYGQTICPLVDKLLTIDTAGNTQEVKQFAYSYRHTQLHGYIYQVQLRLRPKAQDQIEATIKENIAKRVATQPLHQPNLGCIFANPSQGVPAGKLIDDAGCKGKQVGGAAISGKHANFIVNTGGATARDVLTLMEEVQTEVSAKFQTNLTPEIKIL